MSLIRLGLVLILRIQMIDNDLLPLAYRAINLVVGSILLENRILRSERLLLDLNRIAVEPELLGGQFTSWIFAFLLR